MMWDKKERYFYCTTKDFNGDTYKVDIWVEDGLKFIRYWAGVSSGRKRKDLEVYEEKDRKSKGGIKALNWAKDTILAFPDFYKNNVHGRREYICINWSDNKRRNIYERLKRYGFNFYVDRGEKILMKKL